MNRRPVLRVHNCLPSSLAHYCQSLADLVDLAGGRVQGVYGVDLEVPGRSSLRKLGVAARILFEQRRTPGRSSQDRLLVAWPAFGYLDLILWRPGAGRVAVVLHDPLALRRQRGLGVLSRGLARSYSAEGVELVVHSAAALEHVHRLGFPTAVQLPLPMRQPSSKWTRGRSIVVLGQYKAARDLKLLGDLGPRLEAAGLLPEIWGRGWPEVSGWKVHEGHLSEAEFDRVLHCSAAVLLPYTRLFQSDVAVRAAEAGVPVVGQEGSNLTELYGRNWPGVVAAGANASHWLDAILSVVSRAPTEVIERTDRRYEEVVAEWSNWLHDSADGSPLAEKERTIRRVQSGMGLRWAKRIVRTAELRRLSARVRPLLHRSTVAAALQSVLLDRIDVVGYNSLGPPGLDRVVSQTCTAAQILEPRYEAWAKQLGETPRFHRKQWEYVVILEAARQADVLHEGASAVGFGVGTEPLPAVLASLGVDVLATDQAPEKAGHWSRRSEHASEVAALEKPWICRSEQFYQRVQFRQADMNRLLGFGLYDLVWSACAIEHLGSPSAGLKFVRESLKLLAPGGLAVHTTEFELTRTEKTADYGHCAVYRLSDLTQLCEEVTEAGFEMEINPYVAFEHAADRSIAPPFSRGDEQFHLKLALYESITTSFAIIIRRLSQS